MSIFAKKIIMIEKEQNNIVITVFYLYKISTFDSIIYSINMKTAVQRKLHPKNYLLILLLALSIVLVPIILSLVNCSDNTTANYTNIQKI